MPPRTDTFSKSAFESFIDCEQKFYYRYQMGLRPYVEPIAPRKGIVVHDYLASYYTLVQVGVEAGEAHMEAAKATILGREQAFLAAAQTAYTLGMEEEAAAYANLTGELVKIVNGYFETRGLLDAERYRPLLVEKRYQYPLIPGRDSVSIVDLVTQEQETGAIAIWEHKSTSNVPSSSYRVRDFQTLSYSRIVEAMEGWHIDFVLWNYIRTKLPQVPHQNKPLRKGTEGSFSRSKDIDTTWPIYKAAVEAAGQNPAAYADVEERLRGREHTVFFPRYEHAIVASDILIEDYVQTAKRVRQAEFDWAVGRSRPVRTLTRNCDWCAYGAVCMAALTGGSEADAIKLRFTTREERNDIMHPELSDPVEATPDYPEVEVFS